MELALGCDTWRIRSSSHVSARHTFLFIVTAVTFLSLWHWGHTGPHYYQRRPFTSHFLKLISQHSAIYATAVYFLLCIDLSRCRNRPLGLHTLYMCLMGTSHPALMHSAFSGFHEQLEKMKKLHRLQGWLWPQDNWSSCDSSHGKAEIKKILIWREFDKEKREPGQSSFSFSQSGEMRLLKPLQGITFVFSVSFSFSDSFWDLWTTVILWKPSFSLFLSFFLHDVLIRWESSRRALHLDNLLE